MKEKYRQASIHGRKAEALICGKKMIGYVLDDHFYFYDNKPKKINKSFVKIKEVDMANKRDVPDTVISYIEGEMEKVEFGKITIELKGRGVKIDVITEQRKRFENGEKRKPSTEFRKG